MFKRLNRPPANALMRQIDWWQGVQTVMNHKTDTLLALGWTAAAVDLCLLSPVSGVALSAGAGLATMIAARAGWHRYQQRREQAYRERQLSQIQLPTGFVLPPSHRVRYRRNSYGALGASLLGLGAGFGVYTAIDRTTGPQPVLAIKDAVKTVVKGPVFKPADEPVRPLSAHDGIAVLPCLKGCDQKPTGATAIAQP